ncbi:hypothetical protein VOLCADRAFT_91556 [Volvox carteri f. nagariensis]|uniref:Uncharacterized protein n=1 Tax=Volvox carteri f. nagariensis TaxID=3068 RepID=D8TXD8_VOLCA|nr:uncharacterized protein VOLCADRAFT_91556 [Volvox carteri f. nagariensis]EFJ47891.1 hypothetical protein VOLCADRAFT_91556 [Volvox carteri f. nagariensis]|eukprot:XP_002950997.1 hypothetical protein VOLCADRAFT_91556 [Volvox carteri f. nagariensis]
MWRLLCGSRLVRFAVFCAAVMPPSQGLGERPVRLAYTRESSERRHRRRVALYRLQAAVQEARSELAATRRRIVEEVRRRQELQHQVEEVERARQAGAGGGYWVPAAVQQHFNRVVTQGSVVDVGNSVAAGMGLVCVCMYVCVCVCVYGGHIPAAVSETRATADSTAPPATSTRIGSFLPIYCNLRDFNLFSATSFLDDEWARR